MAAIAVSTLFIVCFALTTTQGKPTFGKFTKELLNDFSYGIECHANGCFCKEGYEMVKTTCKPICTEDCGNGSCVAPNMCSCYHGNVWDETLSSCVLQNRPKRAGNEFIYYQPQFIRKLAKKATSGSPKRTLLVRNPNSSKQRNKKVKKPNASRIKRAGVEYIYYQPEFIRKTTKKPNGKNGITIKMANGQQTKSNKIKPT